MLHTDNLVTFKCLPACRAVNGCLSWSLTLLSFEDIQEPRKNNLLISCAGLSRIFGYLLLSTYLFTLDLQYSLSS